MLSSFITLYFLSDLDMYLSEIKISYLIISRNVTIIIEFTLLFLSTIPDSFPLLSSPYLQDS